MRQYELMYILDPALGEEQQAGLVQRFQTLVESNGGSIQHLERWERRRLAYEIKGRREGFYVVMNFQGSPEAEAELGRVLGLSEHVVRHMILRMDDRIAEKSIAEARRAAEAKAAEARAAEVAAAAAEEAAAAAAAAAAEAAEAAADDAANVEEVEEAPPAPAAEESAPGPEDEEA